MIRTAALAVVLPTAAPAIVLNLAGQATVIDRDAIEIHGQRIRLFGGDAPESNQTCADHGNHYRCGQQAALALADHIGRHTVICERRGYRYERIVAWCFVAGADISAWLAEQGLAVAARKCRLDYVDEEEAARRYSCGVWRGDFEIPWEWGWGVR